LVLVESAALLHPGEAIFEAMLDGWRRQHAARRLSPTITSQRQRTVRRFAEFTGAWPWQWRAEHLDAWVAKGRWAHSTVRSYQGSIAVFLDYLCDPRYGWAQVCQREVGEIPVQICDTTNRAVHVADYEGRPERRPLTRTELQALFDVADQAVADAARSARKGWLPAFRDATLIKVIYAWGLRRTEAAMLDVSDFTHNPAAKELGRFGTLDVRFGKAMRGSPPRRRAVASVMPCVGRSCRRAVRRRDPPPPRRRFARARHVAHRARHPHLVATDRRALQRLAPRRGASHRALGALPAPQLHLPPHRRRRRSAVRPAPGGTLVGVDDRDLHEPSGIASDASKTPGRLLIKGSE
jgi:integrase